MRILIHRPVAGRGEAARAHRSARRISLIALLALAAAASAAGLTPGEIPLLEGPLSGFKVVHGLVSLGLLFGAISLGVVVAGAAIELILSVEALHKFALVLAAFGPLSMAEPAEPAAPAPEPVETGLARSAATGFQIGLYGGGNSTPMADVFLKQPNGTDMVLKDVPWTGEPFEDPPYYGVRGIYWLPALPRLGAMIDFAHAKSISLRQAEVEQSGTLDGEPVPPRGKVGDTFTKLEYSHGLNFLTLNAIYRFGGWHQRFLPYIGAGAGLVIPHTEIARTNVARENWTYRYEISGPGFQGFAGLEMRLFPSRRYAIFGEYKAGYAINSTELLEGGTVTNNLWAHQAILGVYGNVGQGLPVPAN